MRRNLIRLAVGLFLSLVLGITLVAQEKKGKSNELRVNGRIQMLAKDTSTITLQVGSMKRTVIYSPDTKITYRNKPASIDELKEGLRVIVLGTPDDKGQIMASRIDVREGK